MRRYLTNLAWKYLFVHQLWTFFSAGGGFTPKWEAVTSWPQKTSPCTDARHTTYRSLRSVHPFLHSSPFYPIPRNRMLCNRPDTPLKYPVPVGASADSALSSNTLFLGSTQRSIPNGISISSAAFPRITTVTDRQTDNRPRCSVCDNRPHLYVRRTRCSLRKKAINSGKSYKSMRRNISSAIYEKKL